jgi:hypothetical protein
MNKLLLVHIGLLSNLLSSGQPLTFRWARNIPSPTYIYPSCLVTDAAGNVYTTGGFRGTSDFDPGPGVYSMTPVADNDLFVSKLDSAGNFVWAKSMGGIIDEGGSSMALDAAGNIYVTGMFAATVDFDPGPGVATLVSNGAWDGFVLKLDGNGNFLWVNQLGSAALDMGTSVAVDSAGNVVIKGLGGGGSATIDLDPGPGTYTVNSNYLLKLDGNGNFLWGKALAGVIITLDGQGNIYNSGQFSNATDFDPGPSTYTINGSGVFVSKLDPNGNFVWATGINCMSGSNSIQGGLVADSQGNVFCAGSFSVGADLDPGPGINNVMSANGSMDMFVMKLDPAGNMVWAKHQGGPGFDQTLFITMDVLGNLYTTGYFENTMDFDPGPNSYTLSAAVTRDAFVTKLDPAGNFLWAGNIGGGANNNGDCIRVDPAGNIYLVGNFTGTADFDLGPATYTLNGGDMFICKMYQAITVGINDLALDGDQTFIYPNPGYGRFSIQVQAGVDEVEVYNSLGQLVFHKQLYSRLENMDLGNQASGVYVARLLRNKKPVSTHKLVKQAP